ncbi:MAG TPA: crotonase/enoyl-CoA hydratase family protein [Burkholderiaceae bacterium]|nr:crotonase/enoyl-CoA hydratase family protein [Burkholderiaceae bacterium]
MSNFLLYDYDDGVVTLTMNRPDKRNALSETEEMLEFVEMCRRLEADARVSAVVVTGAGTAFSSGGDVKHMRDKKSFSAGSPVDVCDSYRSGIQQIPLALWNLSIPTIAAINGHAIGAGLDLACMCDIRIASEEAKMAASFIKLGIVPADGGAWLLSRTVGGPKALEMMLTGDMINAHRALELGLVSRVVPHDSLLDEAHALARKISAHPPRSLRLTKRLLRESERSTLASSLELAAAYQALAHHTKDHDEAVNAFIDKRPPVYRGE